MTKKPTLKDDNRAVRLIKGHGLVLVVDNHYRTSSNQYNLLGIGQDAFIRNMRGFGYTIDRSYHWKQFYAKIRIN